MSKLEEAAIAFCAASFRLLEFRILWRKLKQEHNADTDARCLISGSKDQAEWCDACKAYPLNDYLDALRCRSRAKRQMRTRYAAMLKQEAVEHVRAEGE